MRRSVRHTTKSLKAELEDNAQDKYKLLCRKKTAGRGASIRVHDIEDGSNDDEAMEGGSENESDGERESGRRRKTRQCGDSEEQTDNRGRSRKGSKELATSELEIEGDEECSVSQSVAASVSQGRWRHYPSLCASLPGREPQIQLLLTLMGEPTEATCPALHVYGNTTTGKTLTLKTILNTLQVPHAFVNLTECYSSRLLYCTILSQLTGTPLSLSVETGSSIKCDSLAQFIYLLQKHIDENGLSSTTIYIVLDKAEKLREMEPTLLPALLRLSELTHHQVCTILISELVWEKFSTDTGCLSPYPIHFPQYTKSEVLAIMCRDCPAGEALPFYTTFVNHIWNVFQCVCRDLAELRHLSSLLYPKYCEPVETGEIGRHETRKLWRHIEPFFRGVTSKIYLRELSTTQWKRVRGQMQSGRESATLSSLAQDVPQSKSGVVELPHYSKYLLVASYLASYNPSKTDKKFFSKQKQTRVRKSKKSFLQKEKPNYQLLGPKPFPLDRLMAIFYSILEEPVAPSADIYCQVSSLVSLQLVCQLHTKDTLDGPKYKCLVTLDTVQQIARSIGFDIVQYLYDFN